MRRSVPTESKELLANTTSPRLQELAEARGFAPEFLIDMGVWVDDDPNFPIVIEYRNLLGVWYERRRAWIGSTTVPKYLHPKGEALHLYNPLRLGPNTPYVWFTEGEFDALTLIALGLPAVGIPGTNAFRMEARHLYSGATVIVACDGDEAGSEAADKTVGVFIQLRTRVFKFPTPDGEDINSLYLDGSLEAALQDFAVENGLDLEDMGWLQEQ